MSEHNWTFWGSKEKDDYSGDWVDIYHCEHCKDYRVEPVNRIAQQYSTTPSLHVLYDELEFEGSDGKPFLIEPGTDIVLWKIRGNTAYLSTEHVYGIELDVSDLPRFLEPESTED